MKTGISIGLHIRERLIASPDFRAIAGDRVHSFPAELGVEKPYVTYAISGLTPDYTKDGWNGDTVMVTVEAVADDTSVVTTLAEIIREVLEERSVDYGEWKVGVGVLARGVSGYSLELGLSVFSLEFAFIVS